MILLNEVAKAGPYMIVYKDSEDARKFYYMPRFAELAKRDDGTYIFGMMLFKNPSSPTGGFSVYNMTVRGVMPGPEYIATKDELEKMTGGPVSIVAVPGFSLTAEPITDLSFAQTGGKVQVHGGNLFTDLAISMTFQAWCEPNMAQLFMSAAGWTGAVNYSLTGLLTSFKARIRANWHRVQDHFKSKVGVKYWFVSANLSYETQKLIEKDIIHIEIEGGTPDMKAKVYAMAKEIAARLFVRTVQLNPLPEHPSGGIISLSINYSKLEEDKVSEWVYEERDYETRTPGMAIVIGNVPKSYFKGLDKPVGYSLDVPFEFQMEKEFAAFEPAHDVKK